MAGRHATLIAALCLALTGCEQLDSLRQGILSTYSKELRNLATDIDRQELAKIKADDERRAAQAEDEDVPPSNSVQQAQWQPVSLVGVVQLRPPVPIQSPP